MEKFATFTKTFDEALTDEIYITNDNELIAVIKDEQYVVKIKDNKCKYYKVLQPREI